MPEEDRAEVEVAVEVAVEGVEGLEANVGTLGDVDNPTGIIGLEIGSSSNSGKRDLGLCREETGRAGLGVGVGGFTGVAEVVDEGVEGAVETTGAEDGADVEVDKVVGFPSVNFGEIGGEGEGEEERVGPGGDEE